MGSRAAFQPRLRKGAVSLRRWSIVLSRIRRGNVGLSTANKLRRTLLSLHDASGRRRIKAHVVCLLTLKQPAVTGALCVIQEHLFTSS